jgi:hypothetical protein
MYKLRTSNKNLFFYRNDIDKDKLDYFDLLYRYDFICLNGKYVTNYRNLEEILFQYENSHYSIRIIKYRNYNINISVFRNFHFLEDYDKEFDNLEDVNKFLNELLKVSFRSKKIKKLI